MDLAKINYIFNEEIIYKKMPDMLMAYNQESGDTYEFNNVGSIIFEMLAKNVPMEKILEKLMLEYDTSKKVIYSDVSDIVSRMIDLKIIIVKGDS